MNLQGRKLHTNCIALIMSVVILMTSIFVIDMNVFAANHSTGTVTATTLNLRSGIGTEHGKIATLPKDEIVEILVEDIFNATVANW